MQQPLFGAPDSTVTQLRSAKIYGIGSVFAFIVIIGGAFVAATSKECLNPAVPYLPDCDSNTNCDYWYSPPLYCTTSIIMTSIFAPLMLVGSVLTFCALYQMSKISPIFASKQHYRCMIIWAIVLTALSSVIALEAAAFSLTQSYYFWFCSCSWNSTSCSCDAAQQSFQNWVDQRSNSSSGNRAIFMIASWSFFFYIIASNVVQSRIKYWCCLSCKNDCQHCVRANSNSCGCCYYAPGEDPNEIRPHNTNFRPLVVAPQTDQTATPLQNEVENWLNDEVVLPQYLEAFTRNGFDRMDAVLHGINSEQDLREIAPDILKGHTVLILKSLEMKRNQMRQSVPTSGYGGIPVASTQPAVGVAGSVNYPRLSRAEGNPPPTAM